VDFYRDFLTCMQYPVTKEFILKLCRNWILWSRDCEDAINPSKFVVDAGIHWNTCMRWCAKFEELAEAYAIVKRFVGLRNEKKIADVNTQSLSFMLPAYLDEYKDQHEWRSSVKAKEQSSVDGRPITIVLPKYPTEEIK